MHKPVEGSAMQRNLAYDARADVRGIERRNHEDCFETWREMSIHESHLKLVLEIAHRPESADDERRADASREIHQQPLELMNLDARVVARDALDQVHPLAGREERLLQAVDRDGNDELVYELAAPADEILMAARYRIEA